MNDAVLHAGRNEFVATQNEVYEWNKGDVRFRLVAPAGQNTDFMSSPWMARVLGYRKEDPRTWRASRLHDLLYFYIRTTAGVLPAGMYQYWHPAAGAWRDVTIARWTRKDADQLFRRILIEDGFPTVRAKLAYLAVRAFGGIHIRL